MSDPLNVPVCSQCGESIWGNYGDGKWRHRGKFNTYSMKTKCQDKDIRPK